MICSCILAIAILLGGASGTQASPQQETDRKSTPSQQPAAPSEAPATPDKAAAPPEKPKDEPQSSPPEKASNNESEPGASAGQAEKPKDGSPQAEDKSQSENNPQPENKQQPQSRQQTEKEPQPENQKGAPCGSPGSAQGKCGKAAGGQSHRVVIRRGGTVEPTAQLAPGMTAEQAARHRQTTEEYLNSVDGDLRQLGSRNLSQNQQDTVSQIRNYVVSARSALDNGDLTRARNLAFKAHLLADDLVKH